MCKVCSFLIFLYLSVYLRNDDEEDDSSASFVGGCPVNEPMKSEDNTKAVDLIRLLEYFEKTERRFGVILAPLSSKE